MLIGVDASRIAKEEKAGKILLSCPACGSSSDAKFLKNHHDYKIIQCRNCGLRYSDPMKEPAKRYYTDCAIYQGRSKSYRDRDFAKILLARDWRFSQAIGFIESHFKHSSIKILDIGCGDGGFLFLAKNKGFGVYGIDIDPKGIGTARDFFKLENVRVAGWKELKEMKEWQKFDVVTLFDTLEHVSSPKELTKTIFNLVKPEGFLFLTVPSFERSPRLFDPEADFPPHHLTLWTKKSLQLLLMQAGFRNPKIFEKPFSGGDLYLHLIWFIRRQRPRKSESKSSSSQNRGEKETHFIEKWWGKVIYRFALIVLGVLAGIIRLTGKSRGQTLLAVAQK